MSDLDHGLHRLALLALGDRRDARTAVRIAADCETSDIAMNGVLRALMNRGLAQQTNPAGAQDMRYWYLTDLGVYIKALLLIPQPTANA